MFQCIISYANSLVLIAANFHKPTQVILYFPLKRKKCRSYFLATQNRHFYNTNIIKLIHYRDERDELSEAVAVIRAECNDMKAYLQQVESRHNTAKRVVAALRDELKDERAARDRAEVQCAAVAKVTITRE